jgi:DNA-binding NarL/FixJ family response regulator
VILVEDHVEMRQMLATVLAASGLQVVASLPDGAHFLQTVANLDPDLIVLDIFLPGQSGLELARELRAAHSNVPVIFISTTSDAELAATCRAVGHAQFVAKPRLGLDLEGALRSALS